MIRGCGWLSLVAQLSSDHLVLSSARCTFRRCAHISLFATLLPVIDLVAAALVNATHAATVFVSQVVDVAAFATASTALRHYRL